MVGGRLDKPVSAPIHKVDVARRKLPRNQEVNPMARPVVAFLLVASLAVNGTAADPIRDLQEHAWTTGKVDWGRWGNRPAKYSDWTNHSNRLIPVYTFGLNLKRISGRNSVYRQSTKLRRLYGRLPARTYNPRAEYFDQTDIALLQKRAVAAGKKYVFLVIFDGMDWQTTWAAATYKRQGVFYTEGRGSGLSFQDYKNTQTDFGYMVTSCYGSDATVDVNSQTMTKPPTLFGGYFSGLGGATPWSRALSRSYLLSQYRSVPHAYTGSASSATSMTSGVKTVNKFVNIDPQGRQIEPLPRRWQRERYFSVGVVTSVPISHATPAAAYANNIWRGDYQDLSRDLLGLPSIAHRSRALPGVDVLIGAGWGVDKEEDEEQGQNFIPGNRYLTAADLASIDARQGGEYHIAPRTAGVKGREALMTAAGVARDKRLRLFGYYGISTGHLPFQTADGKYNPTRGVKEAEKYTQEDLAENPDLATMTRAALHVLETNTRGFWLMVESGDVDWANHDNNIDNSIGAVLSGDKAFEVIVDWIEKKGGWENSAVIVTADHGHMLVLDDPGALASEQN